VKRRQEENIEAIYLNKLWKQQMPRERPWGTWHEDSEKPSAKPTMRRINFDDFYAKGRMKKRRQRAVRMGWKPLTQKRIQALDTLLAEKVDEWDREIEEEEAANQQAQLNLPSTPPRADDAMECSNSSLSPAY
jgi:hypothetical protein